MRNRMTRITFVVRDDIGEALDAILGPHVQLSLLGGPEITMPVPFQRYLVSVLRASTLGKKPRRLPRCRRAARVEEKE